jgi:hypothetical protein
MRPPSLASKPTLLISIDQISQPSALLVRAKGRAPIDQPMVISMSMPIKPGQTNRIRALNDDLRRNLLNAHAVITNGVAALGPDAVARIMKTIEIFDDFCHANDPHEEHDFGSFDADGHAIFFKIDYYDSTFTRHSPDPADPTVTERVITIMLAEEY